MGEFCSSGDGEFVSFGDGEFVKFGSSRDVGVHQMGTVADRDFRS